MEAKNPYKESIRYIDNATATLKLAGIEGRYYIDKKYVQTACGVAYVGMLKALDYLFDIKKVPKKRGRKSIDYYRDNLSKIDKKLLTNLNSGYDLLHLSGYYEGLTNIKAIEAGFDDAIAIISALKPYSKNGVK
jgi:hypothetical protein